MAWHLFGALGMMPFGITTDPGLPNFMERAKAELGVTLHGPYRDYDTGQMAAQADALPADDGVFFVGTSLSANDVFIVCGYALRKIQGAFMFQASSYGPRSVAPANVEFAHIIYSYNPIPFPGLGSYIPEAGPLVIGKNYIQTNRNDPHPGDAILSNQELFIADMRRIISANKTVSAPIVIGTTVKG